MTSTTAANEMRKPGGGIYCKGPDGEVLWSINAEIHNVTISWDSEGNIKREEQAEIKEK